MKISDILYETFECVKIKGIYRNLTNDEMRLYKKVKKESKVYKIDLSEYDQNVASSMVIKGLLRRKKEKDTGKLYYTPIGRNGRIAHKELDEVAPPDREIESWIKKNKKSFQDRYGDGYEKYLYGKAWNKYNGKKSLKESEDKGEQIDFQSYVGKKCFNAKENIVGIVKSVKFMGLHKKVVNKISIKDIDTDKVYMVTLDDFEDNWVIDDNS